MLTLAADTSTQFGSIAIFNHEKVLGLRLWDRTQSHGEMIIPELERLLSDTQIELSDLQQLAVGVGPGSFTGIRVAINFIKSLSFSLHLPVIQINSLHLAGAQVRESTLPLSVLQFGFRNLLYIGHFHLSQGLVLPIDQPQAITVEEYVAHLSTPHLSIGTGYFHCLKSKKNEQIHNLVRDERYTDYPRADYFFYLQAHFKKNQYKSTWRDLNPLYIRASEAEEKLKSCATASS